MSPITIVQDHSGAVLGSNQMDECVAQYLCPNCWLFRTIVEAGRNEASRRDYPGQIFSPRRVFLSFFSSFSFSLFKSLPLISLFQIKLVCMFVCLSKYLWSVPPVSPSACYSVLVGVCSSFSSFLCPLLSPLPSSLWIKTVWNLGIYITFSESVSD